jgi:hypothetical protein
LFTIGPRRGPAVDVVVVAASVTIYVAVALAGPVDVADKVFYLACPDVCYENCLARVHRLMGLCWFLIFFINTEPLAQALSK